MRIYPAKLYAVISGDFIGFSTLSATSRQKMYFIVKSGGRKLAKAFPKIMPCEVDMFRGDGWQLLLTDPVISFRAALYFRAYIRSKASGENIDTRMAIAVGTIDYVPENRVSAGDGQAFRRSGRLLEKMGRTGSATMRFAMEDKKSSLSLDRMTRQIAPLADQWTSGQAATIAAALKEIPPKQISANITAKISSQRVDKYLNRAGWPAILQTLIVFEKKISMMTGC